MLSILAFLALQATTTEDLNEDACTSILVSAGASTDGSVFITYSADAPFMPKLLLHPGGEHAVEETTTIEGWEDDQVDGEIPQAPRTASVVGLMNEHQLALGETTTGGRKELRDPEGRLDYDALMWLTLQRATTAREAIDVIHELVHTYGYRSSGETISIADPQEAWMMEIIGKGPDRPGAVWVAARIPDGSISAHANHSRITTFPLDDPESWRYSPDVIDFAVEQGFYDPSSGTPFSYRDAYHPDLSLRTKRVCAARVWSVYRRVAPSQSFSPAFHRGDPAAEDYPLFIQPEEKLSYADVMGLMRDHYEGTQFDMTQGIDAGPFQSPVRFRGLTFEVDGQANCWERPISTQQAGFVMVAQCRSWLPDPVGGVYWFTPDDCYTSCFLPLYCGIQGLPPSYTTGDYSKFQWDSAWWVFNMVSNQTYDRWSRILPDVLAAQSESEGNFQKAIAELDAVAAERFAADPQGARELLTQFSVSAGEELFTRWQELATYLLTKHVDGYVRDDQGRPQGVGYPEEWLRRVVEERPGRFSLDEAGTIPYWR